MMNHQAIDPRRLIDRKFPRFLAAGLLNTLFGYSIYAVLVLAGLPYLIALLLATVAGVVFNYFSFGRMVFKAGGGSTFARFLVSYAVVYGVNSLLLKTMTSDWAWNPYLAQAVCTPVSILLSWTLMNRWVYRS